MKSTNIRRFLITALASACALLTAHTSHAVVNYHVTVNTAPLIGDANAPFAVDFALTGGNPQSNTATLSGFNFGGGSANANPAATTFGLATGSLASSITLSSDPSNFFNEFFQGFTPGNTFSFDLSLTTNINSPTPDNFSFSILDKDLFPITTNGLGNSLVTFDLTGPAPTVQTFSSLSPAGVSVGVVPEPGTACFGLAMALSAGLRRRRSK